CVLSFCFFFQAEDGIRGGHVTGVQTCALPIWPRGGARCRGTDGAAMTSRSGRPGAEAAAPSDESSDVGLDGGGEPPVPDRLGDRSEERRVGKECRSRWGPGE